MKSFKNYILEQHIGNRGGVKKGRRKCEWVEEYLRKF